MYKINSGKENKNISSVVWHENGYKEQEYTRNLLWLVVGE